jgi:hypothetical protein
VLAALAVALTVGSTAVAYAAISGVEQPAKSGNDTAVLPDAVLPAAVLPAAVSLVAVIRQEGPQPVAPRPGMSHVRPIPWQEADPLDDRTVRVLFDSGVEPCYVLDHVTVTYGTDEVTITLYEGSDPRAEGQACIQIAVEKATVVTLDESLQGRTLVDGSPPR